MPDSWIITATDADTVSVVITIDEVQHAWRLGTEIVDGAATAESALALIASQVEDHAATLRAVSTPPAVLADAVGYTAAI